MMDTDDRLLFERSLRHATEHHSGAALDDALDELAWRDAFLLDPHAAVSLLFELQGGANVTSSAFDLMVLATLGVDSDALVLPALDSTAPPGTIDGGRLSVTGLAAAALTDRDRVAVIAAHDHEVVAVEVSTTDLELRTIHGLDPTLGLLEVSAIEVAITGSPTPVSGWTDAVALAQVALGHELVGASRTMLRLACEHALERVQFDQPISSFQAVRHRLADTLVAIETAAALLDAAWLDRSAQNAAMAKAQAGRAARVAARHCQQVLAGIGFTTEHSLHLYIRRALVLDELFGASRSLTRQLGGDVMATRQLPPLLPL